MNKEQQDLVWKCLPKEVREEIKKRYKNLSSTFLTERYMELHNTFGHHNLTSNTEPEEMLMVERKKVQELYDGLLNEKDAVSISTPYGSTITARLQLLKELFGDKYMPDKEESNPKFHKGDIVRNKLDGKIYKIHNGSGFYLLEKDDATIKDGSVAEQHLEPYTPKIGDKVYYLGGGVKDKVYTILSIKGDMVETLPCHWVNVLSLKPYTEENKETMEE